ncbi:protein starmaker-like isoform X2 [Selaginella moellendorffii]|uniref:protein starmaker-like isoform X2 n=1 Tax=Selaginella moellendorffii TaxID=88036 RepID=UPI000D1D0CF8|nr:protein starmaker-like isoform X2 [Selaginella moellendorffii]|eukprot:XP_024520853.1 protein starmaker-like isoform X2 [Selaginella moellendorffii]
MIEIEPAAPSRLTPIGNIYRSTYRRTSSSNDVSRSDKRKATESRLSGEMQRSVSLDPSPSRRKSSPSRSDDVSTMTIEFLRARLLAERSTAKSAKLRIEELENKVLQLERSLELEIEKRKHAEAALQESLEKMLDSSSASGGTSTDSELESFSRAADDDDGKYSDSYLELEDTSGVLNGDGAKFSTEDRPPAACEGNDDDEEEQQQQQQRGGGEEEEGTVEEFSSAVEPSSPKTLETHHNIHSDSDWATDNETDVKQRSLSTAAAQGDTEFDSDSDGFSISLPSQLHLGQLELPGKIGRSLRSLSTPRTGNEWMRHVADMLEKEDTENVDQAPQACNHTQGEDDHDSTSPGVSYVSFSKYLGVANIIENETTSKVAAEDEATSLQASQGKDTQAQEQVNPGDTGNEPGLVAMQPETTSSTKASENPATSKLSSISLRDKVFNSEEERVDEIFRALRAAKAQLRISIQRRQVIEKQLFSSS